jgi:hypothetical protein
MTGGDSISSPVDSSSLGLQSGSSAKSVFEDRVLRRSKSATRPHLPSFKGLGISSFEPHYVQDNILHGISHAGLETRPVTQSGLGHDTTPSNPTLPPRTGSTPLLTPPADLDALKWTISTPAQPYCTSVRPATSVVVPAEPSGPKPECATLSEHNAQARNSAFQPSETAGNELNAGTADNNTGQASFEGGGSSSWLDRSVGAAGEYTIDPATCALRY